MTVQIFLFVCDKRFLYIQPNGIGYVTESVLFILFVI